MTRHWKDSIFRFAALSTTFFCCALLVLLFLVIFIKGISAINLSFLLTAARDFGAEGGIFYQIVGSLLIVAGAAALSFPIALGAALCSSEYMPRRRLRDFAHTLIFGLNGVPSIIFGVFGLIFFVNFLGTGISWFVGSLILAFMILPTIMVSTLHAMESIPQIYRESAFVLGLNKWQVVRSVIIPQSFSGALSGLFIGLARAIGETAPIMFIATAFSGVTVPASLWEPAATLPTHILALTEQATNPRALSNAWGAALALISLVLVFSLSSFFARVKIKRGYLEN